MFTAPPSPHINDIDSMIDHAHRAYRDTHKSFIQAAPTSSPAALFSHALDRDAAGRHRVRALALALGALAGAAPPSTELDPSTGARFTVTADALPNTDDDVTVTLRR